MIDEGVEAYALDALGVPWIDQAAIPGALAKIETPLLVQGMHEAAGTFAARTAQFQRRCGFLLWELRGRLEDKAYTAVVEDFCRLTGFAPRTLRDWRKRVEGAYGLRTPPAALSRVRGIAAGPAAGPPSARSGAPATSSPGAGQRGSTATPSRPSPAASDTTQSGRPPVPTRPLPPPAAAPQPGVSQLDLLERREVTPRFKTSGAATGRASGADPVEVLAQVLEEANVDDAWALAELGIAALRAAGAL